MSQNETGRVVQAPNYPEREPVWVAYRNAFVIVCRLAGVASERHTVLVLGARYERVGTALFLQRAVLHHALQLPYGGFVALADRIQRLRDYAQKQTPEIPVEAAIDVTRSPMAWEGIQGDYMLIKITKSDTERFVPPYRYLGRLSLLSSLQVLLRDRKVAMALPAEAEPPVVSADQLERALSTVTTKLPFSEVEESFLSDTGPDDDLALTVGLGFQLANERMLPAHDLRFVKRPGTRTAMEGIL
jgi:hypothetical protein